jgi:predicted PurR-regulated permease PerM
MRIKARGTGACQEQAGRAFRTEVSMSRLFMILYSMIGTVLAGSAIVVALTMGLDTLRPILIAAALGAVLAVPVSWFVARRIADEA